MLVLEKISKNITLFLFSIVLISCSKEPEVIDKLFIDQVTVTHSYSEYKNYNYSFIYNEKNQLLKSREKGSNELHDIETEHAYDINGRLNQFDIKDYFHKSIVTYQYNYLPNGQISYAVCSYKYYGENYGGQDPIYYIFDYNSKGQIINLYTGYSLQELYALYKFEYDNYGNIVKQTYHDISLSGKVLPASGYLVFTYDRNNSPMYHKGSILYNYYPKMPYFGRFAYSLSPNNLISAQSYKMGESSPDFIYTFDYKYNERRYPVEVKYFNDIHKIDYKEKE